MHEKLGGRTSFLTLAKAWHLRRLHVEAVAAFFLPAGPSTLTWFHQVPAGSLSAAPAQLFLGNPHARIPRALSSYLNACMACTPGALLHTGVLLVRAQRETPANKVVYFVRTNAKGVGEKTVDGDICMGTVPKDSLEGMRALMAELYLPILHEQGGWGRSTPKQAQAFLQVHMQARIV